MTEAVGPGTSANPRLRRFFHAVASGYAQLIAATLYVLAAVPLALHFLQRREFGLWALAMQLGGYLQLVDFGMSSSVSRHLIDHKDNRDRLEYGGMIKTGALVLLLQGLLVLLGGALIVLLGARFLRIDPDLEHIFKVVMFLQCAIIAADFPARLFNHILVAHQRADIANYAQIAFFCVSFATLWYCFAHGFGVLSLVWASLAGWLVVTLSNITFCLALDFLPFRDGWGPARWSTFRELFRFGKDVFWIALGTQLIIASQTILVTRWLGLNVAAVWSVCTRFYTFANQLVWRPFDFSYPMLAEMVARSEKERLLHRFKNLVTLTTSLAVVAAIMFALCNQPFVTLWTQGRISWSVTNDILLAIWMILSALVHCHCSLPGIIKQIGFMRYIYFIEGLAYVITASFLSRLHGFAGIISASILCTSLFTLAYGVRRTASYFGLPVRDVFIGWIKPSIRLFVPLALVGAATSIVLVHLSPLGLVLFRVSFVGALAALLFLRVGLHAELRREICARAPIPVRRLLVATLVGC